MKLIKVGTKGFYAQVDDEDYEKINKVNWHSHKDTYAIRHSYIGRENGKSKYSTQLMHRVIMEIDKSNVYIDHIDGNGLNNQKSNLRLTDKIKNTWNRGVRKYQKNKYKGVQYYKDPTSKYECWKASIRANDKTYTKCYNLEIEAAMWYNEKAKELHGEFAKLNEIQEWREQL